jgi:hypothetical protein
MRTLARHLAPLIALAVVAVPASADAAAAPGGDTPQAVVARIEKAAAEENLPEMMACLTPSARREMALVLVAGAGMMIAFMSMGGSMGAEMAEGMAEGASGEPLSPAERLKIEAQKKEAEAKAAELQAKYEGILDRYGITAMMADETPLPEDPVARRAEIDRLFANTDDIGLMTELMGMMEDLGVDEEESPRAPIALPGAVSDYQVDGDVATAKSGEETLRFRRVDGRWYLDPDEGPATGVQTTP